MTRPIERHGSPASGTTLNRMIKLSETIICASMRRGPDADESGRRIVHANSRTCGTHRTFANPYGFGTMPSACQPTPAAAAIGVVPVANRAASSTPNRTPIVRF
ncbi:hypothetical protein [Natronorubrum sp. DTA7]|uniref:hypothetical protein n=1 Tax=Natronorubrum sp. DTA7 TaxID=3447016 RepID=UPI003F863FD9